MIVVLVGLGAAVALAADDAPDGLWVTVLVALVIVSIGAVVLAMAKPTPDQPLRRIRRLTWAWIALTIVSSPFAYGAPLLLTLPGLAALIARLYVSPSTVPGRTVPCVFLGPAILIGITWFVLRVDEVPLEALPSGAFVIIGVVGLRQLRSRSRRLAGAPA
jgi:hypothetical protein